MGTEEKIMEDYKNAMRSGATERKDALRLMRAALKSAEVDKRAPLTEDEVTAVLSRQAKQRRESIEQFAAAGRDDLVRQEEGELRVLEEYLPRQLSRAEVEAIAREVIAEMGATDVAQVGQVMRQLMPRLQGQADGRLANEVVRELLSQS